MLSVITAVNLLPCMQLIRTKKQYTRLSLQRLSFPHFCTGLVACFCTGLHSKMKRCVGAWSSRLATVYIWVNTMEVRGGSRHYKEGFVIIYNSYRKLYPCCYFFYLYRTKSFFLKLPTPLIRTLDHHTYTLDYWILEIFTGGDSFLMNISLASNINLHENFRGSYLMTQLSWDISQSSLD